MSERKDAAPCVLGKDLLGGLGLRCVVPLSLASRAAGSIVAVGEGTDFPDARSIKIVDRSISKVVANFKGHGGNVTALATLPNGNTLVSASLDKTVKVWDLSALSRLLTAAASSPVDVTCVRTLSGHTDFIHALVALRDGLVVSASDDKTVRVWDPTTGQQLQELRGHARAVLALTSLADGSLVTGSADKSVRVWSRISKSGSATGSFSTSSSLTLSVNDRVPSLTQLLDGSLAVGLQCGDIEVWDISSSSIGTRLANLQGHTGDVRALLTLPDGTLASCSNDETVCLWNAATGNCFQTLPGHTDWVTSAALLSDGRLASTSDDGSIRLWDLSQHAKPIAVAALTRAGSVRKAGAWEAEVAAAVEAVEKRWQARLNSVTLELSDNVADLRRDVEALKAAVAAGEFNRAGGYGHRQHETKDPDAATSVADSIQRGKWYPLILALRSGEIAATARLPETPSRSANVSLAQFAEDVGFLRGLDAIETFATASKLKPSKWAPELFEDWFKNCVPSIDSTRSQTSALLAALQSAYPLNWVKVSDAGKMKTLLAKEGVSDDVIDMALDECAVLARKDRGAEWVTACDHHQRGEESVK